MLEIRAAVAKITCYTTTESGDTLEKIERPNGGFSFVLVDGQGSGRGAKTLSNLLAARAITMLKDGARDDSVALAVHDYLYTYRMGQVAATLNILSVDFTSGQIMMARNNPAPFFVLTPEGMQTHNETTAPIGLHAITHPSMTAVPIVPYTYVVVFTDGLLRAGETFRQELDVPSFLQAWPTRQGLAPEFLTDELLSRAIAADRGRPSDDMSIVTLAVLPLEPEDQNPEQTWRPVPVRRLILRVPFSSSSGSDEPPANDTPAAPASTLPDEASAPHPSYPA